MQKLQTANTPDLSLDRLTTSRAPDLMSELSLADGAGGLFKYAHRFRRTALAAFAGLTGTALTSNAIPVEADAWIKSTQLNGNTTTIVSHHTKPAIGSNLQASTDGLNWVNVGYLKNGVITDTNPADAYNVTSAAPAETNVSETFHLMHFNSGIAGVQTDRIESFLPFGPVTEVGTRYTTNVTHTAAPKIFVKLVTEAGAGNENLEAPLITDRSAFGRSIPYQESIISMQLTQGVAGVSSALLTTFKTPASPGSSYILQASKDPSTWSDIANITATGSSDLNPTDNISVTAFPGTPEFKSVLMLTHWDYADVGTPKQVPFTTRTNEVGTTRNISVSGTGLTTSSRWFFRLNTVDERATRGIAQNPNP